MFCVDEMKRRIQNEKKTESDYKKEKKRKGKKLESGNMKGEL
jgi:hypothetical protein